MSDNATPRTVGAELLVDLADHVADILQRTLAVPADKAADVGNAAAVKIADLWGGQVLYIPKDMVGRQAARDAEIWKRFTGDNASELAMEFDLSVRHILRIIDREREARRQRQFSLPV